jgi:hypothetical protein
VYHARVKNVTGRHSVFLKVNHVYNGWFANAFNDRNIFDLESFVFTK